MICVYLGNGCIIYDTSVIFFNDFRGFMKLSASNDFYASFFVFHVGVNKKIKIKTFVTLDNGCIIYDT